MAGTAPATSAPPRPTSPPSTAAPRAARTGRARAYAGAAGPPAGVDNAAGFILALLFWGWIALPFLKHGPAGVRDTLRAKFFNKATDGSWLP